VTTRNDLYPIQNLRSVLNEPEMRALRREIDTPLPAWEVIGCIEAFNRMMGLPSLMAGADPRASEGMRAMIDAYDEAYSAKRGA
jgi:hypothetical protein